MRKFVRHLPHVLLLCLPLQGCGTLISRTDSTSSYWTHDTYYKSTQADVKLLSGDLDTGYAPISLFCWMSIVCPLVTVVSLPVDAVVDTVALPFDHWN